MIQFIHSYMQLGCLASLELIIQVSDQPVAPSFGRKPWLAGLAATGTPSSFSAKYWYCQVVPTWTSPLAKAEICFAASDQYSPTLALLFLQQVDRRVELFFVQLVGVFDPQVGLVGLQVDRGFGDRHRVVVLR